MTADKKAENALKGFLKEIGPDRAIDRFLSGNGNVRTRCAYAGQLVLYLRWLKEKRDGVTPEWLIEDNLRAVFDSRPTGVAAKRKHTDWAAEKRREKLESLYAIVKLVSWKVAVPVPPSTPRPLEKKELLPNESPTYLILANARSNPAVLALA
jgi:hypothetical protein